jgi:DNA primase
LIPPHTISSVLEASRIEEVVSDFVSLKRRGSNLLGLCPFHQEKTPSFSVSPSKGIFKCFGCGKGGDAARFIMEHEHYSYPEAIRYLAKKYNIDIEEREQTPEEIVAMNERERMFNLNDFASKYYSSTLFESDEGRSVGLSYFKGRDFREATIQKFMLGYSPDSRDAFCLFANKNGYSDDILIKTGLAISHEGKLFDRFFGRVLFPIHNLTGKIIGFGGRILDQSKSKAKYLNSPESEIYIKSKSLYGIYFARTAISKADNCLLVEGYTDVISLHQAGIENVVASSGTSLTIDQIRMIRRYTNNITILFDGDKAGVSASLRGIDLILEEGMNVRVVLFPDGSDPDSYVREHRTTEVEEFIRNESKDFISFKTSLLLEESAADPLKKAGLVKDIVQTIALIPDAIYRSVYVKTCSKMLDVEELTLMNELNRLLRSKLRKQLGPDLPESPAEVPEQEKPSKLEPERPIAFYQEQELIKLLLQYGSVELTHETLDEQGYPAIYKETVAKNIIDELAVDGLDFENPTNRKILTLFREGLEKGKIPTPKQFTSNPEPDVSLLAIDLLSEPYELSQNWERHKIFVKTEKEDLKKTILMAMLHYKRNIIESRLPEVARALNEVADHDELMLLLRQQKSLDDIRVKINQALGIVISK